MRNDNKIHPATKQELTHQYGVSPRTLNKWLKPFESEIGERFGQTYTVKQVSIIYKNLGLPPFLQEQNPHNDE